MKYIIPQFFSLFIFFFTSVCAGKEIKRPNIVLILVDDYGYADISYEGNTQIKTPAIDQIAAEGVRLTNFYQCAAASAPTRASLLTGRYHLRTGVWGVHWGRDFIAPTEKTFADLAKTAGYTTGSFGKWHSGKSVGYHSYNRGFDVGLESNLYNYFNTNVLYNQKLVNVEGPITNVITDQAIRFIEENKDKPFLCYIPYQSIHEPFNCPDEVFKKYKGQGYSDHVARLYGMIEVLDENIGRLTKRISELGLDDNTLIMFLVDDGCSPGFDLSYSNRRMNKEEIAERVRGWAKELRGTKANIYEGGIKSPCYVRWNGRITAGKQIDAISGVIDILPTLADVCGFKIPNDNPHIDGQSLAPLLFSETCTAFDNRFYFDNTNLYQIPMEKLNMNEPEVREMSVRHKNFKLIRLNRTLYGDSTITYELYDLKTDEKESQNVVEQYPEIATLLKDTLSGWFNEMLRSPNAYTVCTYNLGDWSEPSTFINLDGFVSKTGTLERDKGSGFTVTNWDKLGNSLIYNVNVLEEGDYQVELFIDANEQDFGSVIKIHAGHANSNVIVNHTKRIQSGIFHLFKGKQTLTIELASLGKSGKAMDWMTNILVHRLPTSNDTTIIKNPGLKAYVASTKKEIVTGRSLAAFDFCNNSSFVGETIKAKPNEAVELSFLADNQNQIAKIDLYVDFNKVYTIEGFQPKYTFKIPNPGFHTVNAEFTNKIGIRCTSQINVEVK